LNERAPDAGGPGKARKRFTTTQMRRLDRLTATQARMLLDGLALEEYGLPPTPRVGGNCHCCAADHDHINGSASLRVKGSTDGADRVMSICCFGRCQARCRTLSEYLCLVGPEGVAGVFWDRQKVEAVLTAFAEGNVLEIGWNDWKKGRGLPSNGVRADLSTRASSRRPGTTLQNGVRFAKLYHDYFDRNDPIRLAGEKRLIEIVCQKRGWRTELVRQLADQGLVAFTAVAEDANNAMIHFAYRGFFPNPPRIPCRVIKNKIAERKAGEDAVRSFYYDDTYPSKVIGDFSLAHVFYQESERLVFAEGEPDCISWLHYHPDDAVICLGNQNMYKGAVEVMPLFNVAGRSVVVAIDRDFDDERLVAGASKNVAPMLEALKANGAQSISIFVCPKIDGAPHKDVNDFLRAFGADRDPDEFLQPLWSDAERHRPSSTQDRLRRCLLRQSFGIGHAFPEEMKRNLRGALAR